MKDFKKVHNDSEWVALVNYQLSTAEKELMDKEEKTDDDLISLGTVHEKFKEAPSADELEQLNRAYNYLYTKNNISKEDFKLQGAHVTIENNKLRGVVNLISIEEGNFKQLFF